MWAFKSFISPSFFYFISFIRSECSQVENVSQIGMECHKKSNEKTRRDKGTEREREIKISSERGVTTLTNLLRPHLIGLGLCQIYSEINPGNQISGESGCYVIVCAHKSAKYLRFRITFQPNLKKWVVWNRRCLFTQEITSYFKYLKCAFVERWMGLEGSSMSPKSGNRFSKKGFFLVHQKCEFSSLEKCQQFPFINNSPNTNWPQPKVHTLNIKWWKEFFDYYEMRKWNVGLMPSHTWLLFIYRFCLWWKSHRCPMNVQ